MMFPCFERKHRSKLLRAVFSLLAVTMLLIFSGVAFGASGEDGGAKGWVATDTYKVMNFAVLAIALIYLLRKPVSQALNDRIKGIKEQLGELEAQKKKAEDELAGYNEKFKQLDQEAEKLIAQYIQQGEDAKAKIIKEAEAAADKLEDQARRNIEHEFKKAKEKLQVEVLEKAMAQAEDIIKARISGEDHERLVDEYLDKVVA
jgi:F-type H+-transporting ATPase subunit b